jgi:hypothetical protein
MAYLIYYYVPSSVAHARLGVLVVADLRPGDSESVDAFVLLDKRYEYGLAAFLGVETIQMYSGRKSM